MPQVQSLAILHVGEGGGANLVQQAERAGRGEFLVRSVAPTASRVVDDPAAPQIVVIDADVRDPLRIARGVREQAPFAEVVFLVPPEKLNRFRSGLPFVPHLASAWTAGTDSSPQDLLALFRQVAETARQRMRSALVSQRINRQLAGDAADSADRRLRQLAISEGYLATLLSQAPVAFIGVASNMTVVAWNTAACELFGRSAEDAIGSPLRQAAPAEVAEALQPLIRAAFDAGVQPGQELRFRRPNGEQRWIECSLAPVRDPQGDIASVSIAIHDLTERRATEARLRESESRYKTLTEALPQLVWTALPDGRCDYLSRQWLEYTGVAELEQLGFNWIDKVIHPDDRAHTYEAWTTALSGEVPYDVEYRIRRRDGVYRWFKARAGLVRATDGTISHWFGTCTDIQDIVEAREVLARSAAELEARVTAEVAERTKAEAALRQAQKMEAVGHLTGGIAHDFNNLLQGIIGSLDLMSSRLEKKRFDQLGRLVEGALTSARRAAALTHRLLAFSRRQPLNPAALDANRLIASMEELFRRTLGEHVQLVFAPAEDLWTTLCDANQLESALLNLVINARDAMPDGGRLTIETTNVVLDQAHAWQAADVAPGDYVCICVSDTGTGMTPDVLSQAFDPFFTTKPIGQGTGLGLSMIYGFARQSGGHAALYSEVGGGTSVKLYLPRTTRSPVREEAVSALPAEMKGRGEVILVVEDEPVVRRLVVDVLSDIGYNVLEAGDGPVGLQILQSDAHVDLLVSDIGLPGLNGRQLADAARLTRPELKVLFMTGYAERATLSKSVLEPGMTLITKPFAVEALSRKVSEILQAAK